MSELMLTFKHTLNGVTFAVEVRGSVPAFRFVIVAEYQGVNLYTQHNLYRFAWTPSSRETLENIAQSEFKNNVANKAYLLAVNTAHRMKEDCYRPFISQ